MRNPDEWIEKLAKRINEKDHRELIEKEFPLHHGKVVGERSRHFWCEFVASMKQNVDKLKAKLGNPVLSGDLKLTTTSERQLSVTKDELPYVMLNATFTGNMIRGNYARHNPRRPQQPQVVEFNMEFKVDNENHVYLEWDGLPSHNGGELARAVMELLFTV